MNERSLALARELADKSERYAEKRRLRTLLARSPRATGARIAPVVEEADLTALEQSE